MHEARSSCRSAATRPVPWGPPAHHDGSALYVSNPYPAVGETVTLRVRVDDGLGTEAVHVRSTVDGDQHFTPCRPEGDPEGDPGVGETWWRCDVVVRNLRLSYRFLITTPTGARWLTALGLETREVPDVHDFRLTTDPAPPAWAASAVFYEIFLDRFAVDRHGPQGELPGWAVAAGWDDPVVHGHPDAVSQLYRGDLWGVADHLDHIAALGATGIYLTPFFAAGSNHRYDASSFDEVDPLLGGDAALAELTHQAGARGIRVVGDLTLNHTGSGHDWFRAACADPEAVEASFYLFREHPHHYESFGGVPSLPRLDHRSDRLRRLLFEGADSVAAHYVRDLGLSGWRIDVAQSAGHAGASDRTLDSARAVRDTLANLSDLSDLSDLTDHGDALLVAEHMFDASTALAGDAWHGVMSYAAFTRPVWSWLAPGGVDAHWGVPADHAVYTGEAMARTMDAFTALVPWRSRLHSWNLLDSHDTPRLRTVVGSERFAVATGMLLTFPGVPLIFAGDEIGTDGAGLEQARQPFRWDESTWDRSLLDLHRTLIGLRTSHPALADGSFRWLHVSDDVVVYERATRSETLVVQACRAAHPPVHCPVAAHDLLGTRDVPHGGGAMPADGPGFGVWLLEPGIVHPRVAPTDPATRLLTAGRLGA